MSADKQTKAVALAYEMNSIAPRVVGQGEGYLAEAILAKAAELGIPTRVEPQLVEFLMQLRLNDLVPPELYAAVAEVIAWAHQLDEGLKNPNQAANQNLNPRTDWKPR